MPDRRQPRLFVAPHVPALNNAETGPDLTEAEGSSGDNQESDTDEIESLITALDQAAHDWRVEHGEPRSTEPTGWEESTSVTDGEHHSPSIPLVEEPPASTGKADPINVAITDLGVDLTGEIEPPPAAPRATVEGGLPCVRADGLPELSDDQRWLIDGLWAFEGVGIVAAAPKSGKTWAVLDMAVSVASGTPCFGHFAVPPASRGPVLLFAAEDALAQQRFRLDAICQARGIGLDGLPVHIITAARLRLDIERDRVALLATLDAVEPRLLVLDCLVRLHALPENDAGAMSELLGWIRVEINRRRSVAVAIAHHVTKRGGLSGAAMRGSSDLHAWGDSNLYLRRDGGIIDMAIEHRSAAAPEPLRLKLVEGDAPHLEVVADGEAVEDRMPPPVRDLDAEILKLIDDSSGPVKRDALREKLGVRNSTVGSVLDALVERGVLRRGPGGWSR